MVLTEPYVVNRLPFNLGARLPLPLFASSLSQTSGERSGRSRYGTAVCECWMASSLNSSSTPWSTCGGRTGRRTQPWPERVVCHRSGWPDLLPSDQRTHSGGLRKASPPIGARCGTRDQPGGVLVQFPRRDCRDDGTAAAARARKLAPVVLVSRLKLDFTFDMFV